MRSQAIRDLEQLEGDLRQQAKKVNDLGHASISSGYSAKGDGYERKKAQECKILQEMERKYQKTLNKATNILK